MSPPLRIQFARAKPHHGIPVPSGSPPPVGCDITAASASQAHVQAAINSATAGQVVCIPAGTATWSTGVTMSGITLQGAGGGYFVGYSTTSVAIGTGSKSFTTQSGLPYTAGMAIKAQQKSDGGSNNMVGTVTSYSGTSLVLNITSVTGSGTYAQWAFSQTGLTVITFGTGSSTMLTMTEHATQYTYLQDIHFVKAPALGIVVQWSGSGKMMVARRCRFAAGPSSAGPVHSLATPHGLISSCYFDTNGDWPTSASPPFVAQNTTQFIRMPTVTQASWTVVTPFGNLDTNGDLNFYVEGCTMFGAFTEAVDVDGGMRFIARYNVFDNNGLTSHGQDTGIYGLRWYEFYNNTYVFDDMSGTNRTAPLNYFWFQRGGPGLFTDNVIPNIQSTDYGNKAEIKFTVENLRRSSGPYPCFTGGYYAPRQCGFGYVDGSGATDPTYGYQGDSEPIYLWNNSGGGNYNSPGLEDYSPPDCNAGTQPVTDYIQSGRDYFTSTAKPSYTKYTYPHPLA